MMPLELYNSSGVQYDVIQFDNGSHGDDDVMATNPDEECNLFTFILYVPIFGSVCIFGLVGNTLSFIVLQWGRKNAVATFLLQSLAIADNLFLLTTGFTQGFIALALFIQCEGCNAVMPYLQVYVAPFIHITQFGTIWMTMLIAFNRYVYSLFVHLFHKFVSG